MSSIYSKSFLIDATERAVKTFAQATVATLGAGTVDLINTNWAGALSIGAGAALVSLLTSLGSEQFGNAGTASTTHAVEPTQ